MEDVECGGVTSAGFVWALECLSAFPEGAFAEGGSRRRLAFAEGSWFSFAACGG